jgi:hypothetical protein
MESLHVQMWRPHLQVDLQAWTQAILSVEILVKIFIFLYSMSILVDHSNAIFAEGGSPFREQRFEEAINVVKSSRHVK